ncbi:aspartate/glutamate racemase family protein [Aquimarina sp. 2201CG5-10]|uniref:aspartate/glutamate racemase family protein n=1 Tax=Aquimarina callyspongiae TaxID=3098150 RepID=UPI002AB4DE36|nr:aspartate/glutamate racemase family protein [Aquimarina sp. 2201CG5-10]MDY8135825.1 aspartate/glutamate racemase family protein [Aquimarina sp. 2201CG5-10]
MKTIGLIGGMSWESSAVYYELMNKKVKELLGGFHSAKCILNSVDFAEIESLQHKNDWNSLNQTMIASAKQLENAGADLVILCTNTMHLCSDEIIKNTSIPFLHIATATSKEIVSHKLQKVALLGTKFTMEKDFYKNILSDHKIDYLIPDKKDRAVIHDIIYKELVLGDLKNISREKIIEIIKNLQSKGAQGVILGCTELPLLIKSTDVDIPIFDTAKIHAEKAIEMALKN